MAHVKSKFWVENQIFGQIYYLQISARRIGFFVLRVNSVFYKNFKKCAKFVKEEKRPFSLTSIGLGNKPFLKINFLLKDQSPAWEIRSNPLFSKRIIILKTKIKLNIIFNRYSSYAQTCRAFLCLSCPWMCSSHKNYERRPWTYENQT